MVRLNKRDEIISRMTAEQKLETATGLYYSAKELKAAWLKKIHPKWSQEKIDSKVKEIFLDAGD